MRAWSRIVGLASFALLARATPVLPQAAPLPDLGGLPHPGSTPAAPRAPDPEPREARALPQRPSPALLALDPELLAQLEARGLSFGRVLGAAGESGAALARAPAPSAIFEAVAGDVREATAADGPESPRRPFKPEWLTSARSRFELIGVVNRLDRAELTGEGCGEARLVYRLAWQPEGRPATRLPMTVNVAFPQPPARGSCAGVAQAWKAAADRPLDGIASVVRPLIDGPARIEINYQLVHVPSSRRDMDDNAEYVLRAFRREGRALVPDLLVDTPRVDLDAPSRAALASWVRGRFDDLDAGRAAVPRRFLASRVVSRSPRGLAQEDNRVFTRALGDAANALDDLPFARARLARSRDELLRRLDERTCTGCHQTRGVAGFHLLGEDRDPNARIGALAHGASPHLIDDLAFRAAVLEDVAGGRASGATRPFVGRARGGRAGEDCGVAPGFADWTCADGLRCRDVHHADVGTCVVLQEGALGGPCQDVRRRPSPRPEGAVVRAGRMDVCAAASIPPDESALCAPNWLGFVGGMCSQRCDAPGASFGDLVCAPLPAAGYEADCLLSQEPIEACLARHSVSSLVPRCDIATPCRGDYACARVPGAPSDVGACIPPYFLFQARVDGPPADR